MKTKIFSFLFLLMAATLTVHAQSDVVSLAQAVRIFQNPRQQSANDLLTKQGYQYKGVSTAFGKEYTWVKNMDLTKDGLPTKFAKGNSSLILLDANGKSLYLCIFNAACYKQFQQQAVQMGYKADKADGKSSTLFYMKDDERMAAERGRVAQDHEFHPRTSDGDVHSAQVAEEADLAFGIATHQGDEDHVALLALKTVHCID